jgi:hypothetical protein
MEKRSHLLKFHVAEETIKVKVFGTSLEGQGARTAGRRTATKISLIQARK